MVVAVISTDIKKSSFLWNKNAKDMFNRLQLHHAILKYNFNEFGFDICPSSPEGDAFIASQTFKTEEKAMEKVAREVEWFAFNGSFSDGANATPGTGEREMYGLDVWISLNKNANNSAAVNPLGGNCFYNDASGDGTGSAQVISFATISGALKRMYDNHAPMKQPVLCVTPQQLLDLNNELVKGTVDIAGAIIPRDRNVAGIDIDTVITPFGSIGLMVIDPNIMPTGTAFILDLAYIQAVFTNIPGFGTVFVRDIDQDANARIGKAIYMEMGFEFGPPSYHCKIQAVA